MDNHELSPTQNLNCEVTASDVSFDFGDASRFRKIEFPEQAGLTANSLLQLLPAAAVSDAASKTYILKFPEGVQGTLLHLRRGGYTTTIVDSTSHFRSSASLHPVDPASIALFNVFSIASFATGQYFLRDISSKMSEINRKIDEVMVFLQASKRTELASEWTFVKYALENYATIMLSEPQRIATIGNLQRAKIKAIGDIEFYEEQLEESVKAKTNKDQATVVLENKQALDLASQVYAISSIMEAYYSQNWNQTYLSSIKADAKYLLGLIQNRTIGALKTFSDKISKDMEAHKKNPLARNVTAMEHQVLHAYDLISTQTESPLYISIASAFSEPSKPAELYLSSDGAVYQHL